MKSENGLYNLWTKAELDKLKMISQIVPKVSFPEISKAMGRSEGSCKEKIVMYGWRSGKPKIKSRREDYNKSRRAWTDEEIALLKDMTERKPQMSLEEISAALQKPSKACHYKIWHMGFSLPLAKKDGLFHADGKKVWYG
jgi:hypothetical protein